MAASGATVEAAAKESRANAMEDAVTITSGAKEKVDRTLASAQSLAEKVAHPFDKEARKRSDEMAQLRKAEVSAKQAGIREMAHLQAENERLAACLEVADLLAQGRCGGDRYAPPRVAPPHPVPPPEGSAAVDGPPASTHLPVHSPYPPPPQPLNSAVTSVYADVSAGRNSSTLTPVVPAPPHPGCGGGGGVPRTVDEEPRRPPISLGGVHVEVDKRSS